MMNPDEIETLVTENLPLFTEYGMRLIAAILILIAGWVIGNWVSKRIHNVKRLDPMLASFLGGFAKYGVLAIAIVTVLSQFGVETASLLAVLGAAGLAIGLALQGTLSNVAAGVMLLILRPFNVGDYIQFGDNGGTVKNLGLFCTELATPDNVAIFAPNSAIWSEEVYNYARYPIRRQDIAAGVSYKDDLDKALAVVQDVLDNHPLILKDIEDKKPQAMISNMGESSVDIIARFWTGKDDYWNAKWEITKTIKEQLDAKGLTIPFPTRTLEMIQVAAKSDKEAA